MYLRENNRIYLGILILGCCILPLWSQTFPISLGGPNISKLDWNVRSMQSADMNADGFVDIVTINNDKVSIEILYQMAPGEPVPVDKRRVSYERWEPVLEDAPFFKQSVTVGSYMYALRVGDLNHDGLQDFVYTGNIDPLTIRYQTGKDEWTETWIFDDLTPQQWISTLLVDDFNADNRDDLLVLTVDKLLLFYQNMSGDMKSPEIYQVSEDNAHGLAYTDMDGNGERDIMFLAGSSERSLHVRLAQDNNQFGPEYRFVLDTSAPHLDKWNRLVESEEDGIAPEFLYIQAKTRMLRRMQLLKEEGIVTEVEDLQPRTYSADNIDRSRIYYTRGDFNGDGRADLAGGDSTGARVLLYFQNMTGDFDEPISFPSLNNLSGIAALKYKQTDRDSLVLISEKEKIIGISHYSEKGRLAFPRIIPIDGTPVMINSLDSDNDGDDEILLIEKKDRKYRLLLLNPDLRDERGKSEELKWHSVSHELGDLRRDPSAIFPVTINGDDLIDFIIFIPKEPSLIFVHNGEKAISKKAGEGKSSAETGLNREHQIFPFSEKAAESAIRKGMLSGLELSRVGMGDIDSDGINELIVADIGFARSFEIDDSGELVVIDQYNSRQSDNKLQSPMVVDLDRNERAELILYDSTNQEFQWLNEDESGVFRYEKSVEIGSLDLAQGLVCEETVPLLPGKKGKKRDSYQHILLFGDDRFWSIPLNNKGFKLETNQVYQCDLKDIRYTSLLVGDMNSDGVNEIVTLDGQNHLLEILEIQADGEFKSVLHFTVFEDNLHYQGRKGAAFEPRELMIDDFTGDNRNDLAMLIHDRLLIYYQE